LNVHVLAPEHAPPHALKREPGSGVAVRVTRVPCGNCALHVVPHEIPAGAEVTVPLPVPFFVTLSVGARDPNAG